MAWCSHSATQPLCQSGWSSHSVTQSGWVAEWLVQPLWQSGWVAGPAALPEWLSGWVAAPATLPQPATQPLRRSGKSGWSSHSARVAEWLSGWSSHSGRVAEWLLRFREPCCTSTLILAFIPFTLQFHFSSDHPAWCGRCTFVKLLWLDMWTFGDETVP